MILPHPAKRSFDPFSARAKPPWEERRTAWAGAWLAAACWAGALALLSGLPAHRLWGMCAAAGYLCAAAATWAVPVRIGRAAPLAATLIGAIAIPLVLMAARGAGQSEVAVIERAARLTLDTGTPYLADPGTVGEYTPYLPATALFGLPRAVVGDDGWPARLFGDVRLWSALACVVCLAAGRAVLRRPGPAGAPPSGVPGPSGSSGPSGSCGPPGLAGPALLRRAFGRPVPSEPAMPPYGALTAALFASPVLALPICVSGVDLPLTGLCGLALACAARGRAGAAGLALAGACALKWVAWPAVPVAVALVAATRGRAAAVRCAAIAVCGAAVGILPAALLAPGPMAHQVFAFPLGMTRVATPADSPLPGRLLAGLGPAGEGTALVLLCCGALLVAGSLALRPPRTAVAAADRLAAGLSAAFLLAPAGRFGYLALPVVLVLWIRLADTPDHVRKIPIHPVYPGIAPRCAERHPRSAAPVSPMPAVSPVSSVPGRGRPLAATSTGTPPVPSGDPR